MFVVLVGVVKRDSSALRLTRAETQLGAFSRPLSKDPQHKITTSGAQSGSNSIVDTEIYFQDQR